jgi:transposase
LHRSGELTAVWVPDPGHEALRDLVRAREAAVGDRQRARNRLSKFLLRRDIHKPQGWTSWTQKHLEWIEKQNLEQSADQFVLTEYLHEVRHIDERILRLEQAINEQVSQPPEQVREVIEALAAMRGVGRLTATTLVVEVGSFSRFDSPRELMSYCGVVPSEYSSPGPGNAKRGGITKAGNAHLRRVLLESSWHYARLPRVSMALRKRQAGGGQGHLVEGAAPSVQAPRTCTRERGGMIAYKGREQNSVQIWRASGTEQSAVQGHTVRRTLDGPLAAGLSNGPGSATRVRGSSRRIKTMLADPRSDPRIPD